MWGNLVFHYLHSQLSGRGGGEIESNPVSLRRKAGRSVCDAITSGSFEPPYSTHRRRRGSLGEFSQLLSDLSASVSRDSFRASVKRSPFGPI